MIIAKAIAKTTSIMECCLINTVDTIISTFKMCAAMIKPFRFLKNSLLAIAKVTAMEFST